MFFLEYAQKATHRIMPGAVYNTPIRKRTSTIGLWTVNEYFELSIYLRKNTFPYKSTGKVFYHFETGLISQPGR